MSFLLISFLSKKYKRKKRTLITSIILFVFFTNSFIVSEFMRTWEHPAIKNENIEKQYDYGIVLGGMISYDAKMDKLAFNRSVDRLMHAIDLYNLHIIKKIYIAGGSGSIVYDEVKEADLLKDYLIRIGVPKDDIISESESKNTRENALNVAKTINLQVKPEILLITSASHMRRALACFEKLGIGVDPYSTDRSVGARRFHIDHLLIPEVGALISWQRLIHEVLGFIAYKFAGYV